MKCQSTSRLPDRMLTRLLLLTLVGAGLGLETPEESREPSQAGPLDRVEVISSALRVLPRRKERQRRAAAQWRKPRDYEFVTREGGRSPRRLPYPEEDNYPPQDYFERRRDFPNRRIIYYASLPEVVRRPGEWTPPRPIYYPQASQNEIVTRVQSGLIDVSNPNGYDKYSYNSDKYSQPAGDRYSEELPPRFTIIDAEPPYNRPPPHLPPRPYDRYDYRRHDYRYDYRNHVDPYRGYYEQPSYHHQQLPAQPVTVVRRPVETRPLDVRPLELVQLHPLSTQAPPPVSSQQSTAAPVSTSTSSQEMSSYERSLKS